MQSKLFNVLENDKANFIYLYVKMSYYNNKETSILYLWSYRWRDNLENIFNHWN